MAAGRIATASFRRFPNRSAGPQMLMAAIGRPWWSKTGAAIDAAPACRSPLLVA